MDSIRLRTLTIKSKLIGGKYDGMRVGELLNMLKYNYLRYVYYNYTSLTFTPDILDLLGITDDFIIDKPGKKVGMEQQLAELKQSKMSFKAKSHYESRKRKWKYSKENEIRNTLPTKGKLQSKNHGH